MIYTLFSSSHCFFFFFFNDTATTEIYTLSLHDALPIYICGKTWKNGKFIVLRKTIRKRLIAKLKQVKAALRRRMHQPLVDRKSTRLNSSHSQISYAVFCLKKKNLQLPLSRRS